MEQRVFTCKNCSYSVPISDNLDGLIFYKGLHSNSMLKCPGCGSYTIQKTWDSFLNGEFLVVKSHIKQKGV